MSHLEPAFVLLRPWDASYLQTWKTFMSTIEVCENVYRRLRARNPAAEAILAVTTGAATAINYLTEYLARHGAVHAFGILIEFGDDGLRVNSDPSILQRALSLYNDKFELSTTKSKEEFLSWLYSKRITTKYQSGKYCTVTNSSLHFVKDACQFLGVELPEEVKQLMDIIEIMNKVLLRLRRAPKTFMNFVKKTTNNSGAFAGRMIPRSLPISPSCSSYSC